MGIDLGGIGVICSGGGIDGMSIGGDVGCSGGMVAVGGDGVSASDGYSVFC